MFIVMVLLGGVAAGSVIRVPEDRPTIQQAIDAAADGDEIVVYPGTYYENIQFKGTSITVRSTAPTNPAVIAGTVIDGGSAGSAAIFSGSEPTTCVLSGFTITNGYAQRGAGINGNRTLATIENNSITSNTSEGDGAGLYQCDGTIRNNEISGNVARGYAGAGGGLYDCDGRIENNTITHNHAFGYGGGLFGCDGTIVNNTISDNWGHLGHGLMICQGAVLNNMISRKQRL